MSVEPMLQIARRRDGVTAIEYGLIAAGICCRQRTRQVNANHTVLTGRGVSHTRRSQHRLDDGDGRIHLVGSLRPSERQPAPSRADEYQVSLTISGRDWKAPAAIERTSHFVRPIGRNGADYPCLRACLSFASGHRSPSGRTRTRVPSSALISAWEAISSLISNSLNCVLGSQVSVWSMSPGKICQVEPSSSLTMWLSECSRIFMAGDSQLSWTNVV